MNKLSGILKITFNFAGICAGFIALILFAYLWVIPHLIQSPKVISFVETKVHDICKVDLSIDKPILKTGLTPSITFTLAGLNLTKNNEQLLEVKDFNTTLSYRDILLKRIIIKRLSVEKFYADVNKIMAIFPQQDTTKPEKKFDWDIDIFDALLYAKNVEVLYNIDYDTKLHILSKGFGTNNAKKVNRRVGFNILFDVQKNNERIKVFLKDEKRVTISNKTLYINDLPVEVNNSKFYIKLKANRKIKYLLTLYANNFDVQNIVKLIDSNLVIPDGDKLLAMAANNIKGDFDFNINLDKKGMKGVANLHYLTMNVFPLNNLPVTFSQGRVSLDSKNIYLDDFKGYYFKNKDANKITFAGSIDDYIKTVRINLQGDTFLTNEFMTKCGSKLIGCPVSLVGDAGTRVIIKSQNNKFDILGYSRLLPGEDILVDGMSLTPKNYERIIKADMHFEDTLLKIKGIDYFIGSMQEGAKDFKRKSIMVLRGNVDCKTLRVQDMGIKIPDPLPSEFFNLFAGAKFFRKGFIKGYIHVDNRTDIPVLYADMNVKDVRIPSQRIKIKDASIKTNKERIHINAKGRFKRSEYKFYGNIKNELVLPVIVNNVNLTVDNMDLAKLLESFNQQNTNAVENQPKPVSVSDADDDDDAFVFNTGLIIVNDCNLNLIKGHFNDINIGNLHALLTLDKNGILNVTSNKFDFAEGISTLKLNCDLMKHQYYVRLGVKDVNSDLIASSLLALNKEISGKAKGLIELNTDDSLKLNGRILFDIENGTIGKVGFLEYVLKFAALFRNPMAMISPSTLVDLVNIPDGNFDKINGEIYLKNNVIELMKIKSKAPQLSSFIVGCFDLESRDAILRIYTKMSNRHKGVSGILRNISLNSLANRISFGNSNEANYYSNEIKQLPELDAPEKDCQIFLTKVDGDVERNNFISSLKRIK